MHSIFKYFQQRGTMAGLQLDPKKTALVLIDLQNAILGMNPVPHTAAQIVENSKKLVDALRAHGAPVVYVRVDLNDFMNLPVDQPHNLGDKPLPAAASEIAASAGFQTGDSHQDFSVCNLWFWNLYQLQRFITTKLLRSHCAHSESPFALVTPDLRR
jgi:nicotinamidase-related amidase